VVVIAESVLVIAGLPITAVTPPGLEVAVYCVIGLPPSEVGALQLTVVWVWALPAMAVTLVGGPGGPRGVAVLDGADGSLVPMALVAITVNV
jgi:hypothetical protein